MYTVQEQFYIRFKSKLNQSFTAILSLERKKTFENVCKLWKANTTVLVLQHTFCKGFSKEASVFSMASSVTWLVPVSPPLPWNPRAAIYKMVPLYSQWHKFRNVYNQIHLQFYSCFFYLQSTHPKWVDVYGSCASRWIWCKSNINFHTAFS